MLELSEERNSLFFLVQFVVKALFISSGYTRATTFKSLNIIKCKGKYIISLQPLKSLVSRHRLTCENEKKLCLKHAH